MSTAWGRPTAAAGSCIPSGQFPSVFFFPLVIPMFCRHVPACCFYLSFISGVDLQVDQPALQLCPALLQPFPAVMLQVGCELDSLVSL